MFFRSPHWIRGYPVNIIKTMKSTVFKLLLFVILLFFFRPAVNCQVIKGAVLDIETRKPVSFAYLYFSGTFTGTQSDKDGYFELDVSKNATQQLIISAVGY